MKVFVVSDLEGVSGITKTGQTSGGARRRRSSRAADPTVDLIRSVFGTLFGK